MYVPQNTNTGEFSFRVPAKTVQINQSKRVEPVRDLEQKQFGLFVPVESVEEKMRAYYRKL